MPHLAISCSGNYRSGMVMQGASSEVLMRVNSIVGGGADAHKEGEAQIEQDGGGGGGAPHIMVSLDSSVVWLLQ